MVARIVPTERKRSTVADLLAVLDAAGPMGVDFAEDLEAVRREQPPMCEDPWTS